MRRREVVGREEGERGYKGIFTLYCFKIGRKDFVGDVADVGYGAYVGVSFDVGGGKTGRECRMGAIRGNWRVKEDSSYFDNKQTSQLRDRKINR